MKINFTCDKKIVLKRWRKYKQYKQLFLLNLSPTICRRYTLYIKFVGKSLMI